MLLIRWILSAALGGTALLLDVGNVALPLLARRRGKHMSPVPLLGALLGSTACLLCPVPGTAKAIPVAILLDMSLLGLVVYSLKWMMARERLDRHPLVAVEQAWRRLLPILPRARQLPEPEAVLHSEHQDTVQVAEPT
jgi:hypothetical protein